MALGGGGPPPVISTDREPPMLDDLSLNEGTLGESYNAYNPAAALGRIGGKLLKENLVRNGVDLSFRNFINDPDVLYIDVNNKRIGVKTNTPLYDLDVRTNINTKKLEATNQATVGNLFFQGPNTISTVTGPLNISPADTNTPFSHKILKTSGLEVRANYIGSLNNGNIVLDPNGSGTVEFQATTNANGDINVTGNISLAGDLTGKGTITVGDQTTDTVSFTPDLTQSILTGTDNVYDIGSPTKRWANIYGFEWTHYTNFDVKGITVSDQTKIDGVSNTIFGQQSNEDISLAPGGGITFIEQLKFEKGDITNLIADSAITLASTGNGYFKVGDTGAMRLPAGTTDEAPVSPEVGFTRWNTEKGYLECFDGSIYIISTGPGEVVNRAKMEEYVNLWTLVLG